MLPIAQWPAHDIHKIVGVFTDIDDTLTTDGAISADALAALGRLGHAGLHVIAITGRPVGWSEPFARSWPIDAIVPENGSVALIPSKAEAIDETTSTGLRRLYAQDAATRNANFRRM
ncbi:MAG: HAD hydrolase family protein, partial [Burkholderiaceae bacterium]